METSPASRNSGETERSQDDKKSILQDSPGGRQNLATTQVRGGQKRNNRVQIKSLECLPLLYIRKLWKR